MINVKKIDPPKPRLLVIPEAHPEIIRLFRSARRKAQQYGLTWEVLIIDTPGLHTANDSKPTEAFHAAIKEAEQMGAIVTHVSARKVADGIRQKIEELASDNIPIHSLMVADTYQKHSLLFWRQPLNQQVTQKFGNMVEVTTVPVGMEPSILPALTSIFHVNGREIFLSLLAVAIAAGVIEFIGYLAPEAIGIHNRNKSIIFMLACAFAAVNFGLLAGVVASVASFLTLSMFYIAPYNRLNIDDYADAVNLALFLFAGTVLSLWGSRSYGNRLALARRAERFHSLLKIHRIVLNKKTTEEVIAALDEELKTILGKEIIFFLPSVMNKNKLEVIRRHDVELSKEEEKALYTCWEESKTTGVGAAFNPEGCQWRFKPLITAQDEIGVMAIRLGEGMEIDTEYVRLLTGIADQVALLLERLQLGAVAEENKIHAEREKLRSMLLSSVSHDLKTPLASIIGSLSVFRSMGVNLPDEQRLLLINTALEEAQRLDSFITNILDMTRIESGQIELREEWVRPEEIIKETSRRLRERLHAHKLNIIPSDVDMEVAMDTIMVSQVLQNLLDNAAKYTAAGTQIDVSWEANENGFFLTIRDHGHGIPDDAVGKVFDKYARIKRQDRQVAGTGLGLAIAKAVMLAQEGGISAANHPDGGAVFTLTLPKVRIHGKKKAA